MLLRKLLSYAGVFLKVNGLVMLSPSIVAYALGEDAIPFLAGGILCLAVGLILSRMPQGELSFSEAMVLSALTLLLVSFFGAIPYFFSFEGGVHRLLVDGFFESSSGYTTTGLSVMRDVNSFPRSLLFYRSMTQWVGGVGIVILAFSALSHGVSIIHLFRGEQEFNRFLPSVRHSARAIINIYFFYTVVGFILFWLSGLNPLISASNVFTSLSTGGFSSSDFVYSGFLSKILLVFLMLVGAVSFTVHFDVVSGNLGKAFKNVELRAFLFFILVGVVLFAGVLVSEGNALEYSLDKSFFNVVSALTTTGYSDIDFSSMSEAGKLLTSVFMVVGGGMGSTAGGLKVIRVMVLLGSVLWLFKKISYPKSVVVPFKVCGMVFDLTEVTYITIYFFVYVLVLFVGVIVLNLDGVSGVDGFFVSSSALGTVGLSTVDIYPLSAASKLYLSLEMLLGRVEIASMALLFMHLFDPLFKRKKAHQSFD